MSCRMLVSSFVSTPLQEGQTKISFVGRTPSFGSVRKCFVVSPQVRHTRVRGLTGMGAGRSMCEIEVV